MRKHVKHHDHDCTDIGSKLIVRILATEFRSLILPHIFIEAVARFSGNIREHFNSKMIDPELIEVLNEPSEDSESKSKISNPLELSEILHKKFLQLKAEFLEDDGVTNYSNIRESVNFSKFEEACEQLCYIDVDKFSMKSTSSSNGESLSKAFFVNVYNTLTFHALAKKVTIEKTVLEIPNFWQRYAYRIGPTHIFSLDDIEHGILRCNKLHPTYQDFFFKEGDPRRDYVLSNLDPRIHFVLNCGAKSCPPIRVLSTKNLEYAMDVAAKNFCQSNVEINEKENSVTLSKIFLWYGNDFGGEKLLIKTIKQYFTPEQTQKLKKLTDNFSIKYMDYDWSVS